MTNPAPIFIQHKDNVLGKNILDAKTEAALIADGFRFATVLLQTGQRDRAGYIRTSPLILCGSRCPDIAGREGLRDWMRAQSLVGAGAGQKVAVA